MLAIVLLVSLSGCAIFDGARMLNTKDPEATASPTPVPVLKGIGDACENLPWRIELVGKDEMKAIGQDPLVTSASSGKTLLLLYFNITNISETDDYFNCIYFEAEADGQQAELIMPAVNTIDQYKTAIGTVRQGETVSYCAVYQIPENWSDFKISYDTGNITPNVLAAFEIKA